MEKLKCLDSGFRSEYDFLIHRNVIDRNLTKDEYSNNKILENIIDGFKKSERESARNYLSLVRDKVRSIGKDLVFVFDFSSIKAQTVNLVNKIEIRISTEINQNELQEVFLHELGEAEYIASKFPVIIDTMEREDIKWRMIEIFTHGFIHHRLQELGFNNYLTVYSQLWLERNYLNFNDKWKSVLMIIWALTSYPDLLNLKMSLIGYEKYNTYINRIINELNDKELFISPDTVLEACKTVKSIFDELGAEGFIVSYFSI